MVSFLLSIEAKHFCVCRKMEKSEFRAVIQVIKHLYLKGLTPKEIKAEFMTHLPPSLQLFTIG